MKLTNDGYRIAFLEEYKDVCKIGKSVLVKLISLDRKNDSVNKRDLYEIHNILEKRWKLYCKKWKNFA